MQVKEVKVPKKLSPGEECFALHCQIYRLVPEREYQFVESRKWRFDFYFPTHKIAIEIEGGTWSGGRHGRGAGMERDMDKYNYAAKLGIMVLRYTTKMVQDGCAIHDVLEMMQ